MTAGPRMPLIVCVASACFCSRGSDGGQTALSIRIRTSDQEADYRGVRAPDAIRVNDSPTGIQQEDKKEQHSVQFYGSETVDVHSIESVCSNGVWQPLTSTVRDDLPPEPSPWPYSYFYKATAAPVVAKADMVVAHCSEDLSWITKSVAEVRNCGAGGIEVQNIYVYSKCGNPVTGMPPNASLVQLPNVGRNDHTFAFHLARNIPVQPITIFIKDTYHSNRRFGKELEVLGLCHFATVAMQNGMGFGCGMRPRMFQFNGKLIRSIGPDGKLLRHHPTVPSLRPLTILDYHKVNRPAKSSAWHMPSMLGGFRMDKYESFSATKKAPTPFQSPVRPLRRWAKHTRAIPPRAVDRIFDRKLVPVCYGGQFAVVKENIERIGRKGFANLRDALRRGDNIEEGHFAERLWAALLTSKPFWPDFERIEKRLISLSGIVHNEPCDGMLLDCLPWEKEPEYRRRRRGTKRLSS